VERASFRVRRVWFCLPLYFKKQKSIKNRD